MTLCLVVESSLLKGSCSGLPLVDFPVESREFYPENETNEELHSLRVIHVLRDS